MRVDNFNENIPKRTIEELMGAFRRFHRRQMEMEENAAQDRKRSEGRILLFLSAAPAEIGLKVSELSKKMRVTSPFVTQLLNSLEESRLIKRMHDQQDRRMVRVLLTEEGQRAAEEINSWLFKRYSSLSEHLGEEESKQLAELLHKTFDYLDAQDKLIYKEGEDR